ncbi:hypothetical protein MnTg02_00940 [bacterium MnTg02]|nr:hypothetical protein MnTg02_00940 [bacterium MnTg02]
MTSKRTDLDSFLETLPTEAAAEAKSAAAKIDDLERVTQSFHGIEAKYFPWLIASIVLFIGAVAILIGSNQLFGGARMVLGGLGLTAMAAALPALAMTYVYQVRERTRSDRAKAEINRTYFVSHGGYYFPPSENGRAQVFLIEETTKKPYNPRKPDRLRPGWYW